MNYELDPQRMLVHVTGTMQYTMSAETTSGPPGPKDLPANQALDWLFDISTDPPAYVGKA
jgi:hypothetical protein